MANYQERQDLDGNLPFKISLNKTKEVFDEVETDIQIIFVLKGSLHVDINSNQYDLEETDVIFINNEDVYSFSAKEENLTLSLQIDYNFFTRTIKKDQFLILCNSSAQENDNGDYDNIRKILSRILYEHSKREYCYEIRIMSLLYGLISILKANFLVTDSNFSQYIDFEEDKYNERIDNLLSYIKLNYRHTILLQDAAKALFLTPEYLARFFKNHMGTTFFKYLNEFRLKQAVKELIRTQNSVTKVAMNNGFPNLGAFNKLFKEVYKTTPSEYRNEIKKGGLIDSCTKKNEEEASKIDYNQALEKINKYVALDFLVDAKQYSSVSYDFVNLKVDVNEQKFITHTWKNLINLGYAEDGLRSDLQLHLAEIQKHIKFNYARFQGILGDEMLIEDEQEQNPSNYNFTKIDKLIDFLNGIGLKPFIELGNKARLISRGPDNVMYSKYNSNKKRSLKEWKFLLKNFIVHCVNRYGIDEVEQWYFEIWKPGEIDQVLWNGEFDEYISIFEAYYKTIKEIVPNAKIGGPGINPEINLMWLDKLLEHWKCVGITPDFLSVLLYSYEFIEKNNMKNTIRKKVMEGKELGNEDRMYKWLYSLSADRDHDKKYLEKIRKILNKSELKIQEIHVTEWNSSVSHRHPTNDTTFKAAFIAKNIIDNLGETSSFGYWLCSDISGELKDSRDLLYGDLGLISVHGIKKPAFYVYELLAKLGNKLIRKGEGYVITSKSKHNYEVLVYNYKHFDPFFCLNEDTSIPFDQFYSIYENGRDLKITVDLDWIEKGCYRIKKYTLNREYGSVFDEWLRMNSIQTLKQTEIEYLKQICIPRQSVWYEKDKENVTLESQLMPHEINLFEISLEYNL